MELKRLITHFTYKIEPRPEGGFIAHPSDPAVSPIEAPTREELQQKIQATIMAGLAAEFPGLQLPPANQSRQLAFHIEAKPGGGFTIHSADPKAAPIEGADHSDIGGYFLEKFVNLVGKQLGPGLTEALAASGNATNLKVSIRKSGLAGNSGALTFGMSPALPPKSASVPNGDSAGAIPASTLDGNSISPLADIPVSPEKNRLWPLLRVLLTALILALIVYFLVLHR
jgi:hypothetical protein